MGYGFVSGGSTFLQNDTDDAEQLYPPNGSRTEVCQLFQAGQVLVDESVCKASFWIKESSTASGDLKAYIRESDGTLVATSTTILDAGTLTGSFVEHTFDFPSTNIDADDMICLNSDDMTGGIVDASINGSNITNGQMWMKIGGVYSQKTNHALRMSVTYACTSLTQGAVDFYLQIAKE